MFETIKKDWFAARKLAAGDYEFVRKANILGLLKSDIERIVKDDGQRSITDEDCITAIKKLLKGINVTIEALESQRKDASIQYLEKTILEDFLPKQLTKKEILAICTIAKVYGAKTMGDYMKYFKENFSGQYDGKLASGVIKEWINQ